MADDNQIVHTEFTAEVHLQQAHQAIEELAKKWQAELRRIALFTDNLDQQTATALSRIRAFNKQAGALEQFQKRADQQRAKTGGRYQASALGEGHRRLQMDANASADERAILDYRRKISKALAGTVVELDDQLKRIDDRLSKIGTKRRKHAAEIATLSAERDTLSTTRSRLAANPFVAEQLATARSQASKDRLRQAAGDDRAMQRAAEDLVRSRMRLLEVETELGALDAKMGGRAPGRIRSLREEQKSLRELITAYEAVPAVIEKSIMNEGSLTSKTLAASRRDIVTQARQYLETEQRVGEIKERIARHEAGSERLTQRELAALKAELAMSERVLELQRSNAAVQERITTLKERAAAADRASAERKFDQDYSAAQAENDRRNRAAARQFDRDYAAAHAENLRRDRAAMPRPDIIGRQAELMGNYALLGGAMLGAYATVDYMVQFEKSMAQFQAIAAASNVETAKLQKTITELGETTNFTNLQIAETATVLAQAGLSASDTDKALGSIARLASAAGVEMRAAADVVTSIASVWNYSSDQFDKIADSITNALNRTKLGMEQIQLGIQYAANTAEDANISFTELTSALGAMAQAGIKSGSTAGTGLRSLITDLEKPTEKARLAFSRLGLTMADVDVRTLGLSQVLHNLRDAGFSSADAIQAFEIRSAAAYAALSNNLDVMQDLHKELNKSGATTEANAVQMDTLAAKWTKFTNTLLELTRVALTPVASLFKVVFDVLTPLLGAMTDAAPVIQGVTTSLIVLGGALAISKVVTLATVAVNALTGAFTGAAGATGLFSRALYGVPILGWISAAAGLVTMGMSMAGVFKKNTSETDRLKAAINELESRLNETRSTLQAVDQSIAHLNTSMAAAADQPVMRGQILEETRNRFEAVGLKVDDTTNSIDGMVEALKRLRTELQANLADEWAALESKLKLQANLVKQDLAEGRVVSQEDQQRLEERLRVPGKETRHGLRFIKDDLKATYGASAVVASEIISGERKLGTFTGVDTEAMRQGRAARDALNAQRQALEKQLLKTPNSDVKTVERLQKQVADLDLLIDTLNQALAKAGTVNDLLGDAGDAERKAAFASWLASPNGDAAGRLMEQLDPTLKSFRERSEAVRRDPNMSAADQVAKADQIQQEAEAAVQKLLADLIKATAGHRFDAEIRKEFDQRRSAALGELTGWATPLRKEGGAIARAGATAAGQAETDAEQVDKKLAAVRAREIEAEIGRLKDLLAKANTEAEIEELKQKLLRLNAELTPLKIAADEASLQAAGYYDRLGVMGEARRLTGLREDRDRVTLMEFFRQNGITIDPQMTAWCAAFVNAVLASKGIKGTGTFAARDFMNFGQETKEPRTGDIVVLKRGDNPAQGHVGFFQGYDDAGNVRVLGGNQSNGVGTAVYRKADVLGYRTVPGGADPRIGQIRAAEAAIVDSQAAERDAEVVRLAAEQLYKVQLPKLKKTYDQAGERIDFLVDTMIGAQADPEALKATLAEIDQLSKARVQSVRDQFVLNPANDMDSQTTRDALEEAITKELITSIENSRKALDAYAAAVLTDAQRAGHATSVEMRRAEGTAGTSGTTMWLLEKRQEWDRYTLALKELQVEEAALVDLEIKLAEARAELAKADTESNRARIALLEREIAARRARLIDAQQNVDLSTPVNGTPEAAKTATAAGPQGLDKIFQTSLERYKETSGAFVNASQTMADGIYGAFGALHSGIEQTIMDLGNGTATVQSLFKNMIGGILKEFQAMAAKMAANWIMQLILKSIMSAWGGGSVGSVGGETPMLPTTGQAVGLPGYKLGGYIKPGNWTPLKRFALGGLNRDSVPVLAEPGEVIMRKSAVDFIGKQNLLNLNALGNRRISQAAAAVPKPREPDQVNVWVVPQNQVPPPGPKDIVHYVASDIQQGGPIKKLVKQVAMGAA